MGTGAFGSVFHVRDRTTGNDIALKQVHMNVGHKTAAALRELHVLQYLAHKSPHMLPMFGAHANGGTLALIMPFVPITLAYVLAERPGPLTESEAACLGRMLLRGMAVVHRVGLLHRDVKPANLLLARSGALLLADFGQARHKPLEVDGSLSHAVATRWYRAPELLLGARRYGPGVDVWACGAVLAQLLTLSPLLPGESDIDQLVCVRVIWPPSAPARVTAVHVHVGFA